MCRPIPRIDTVIDTVTCHAVSPIGFICRCHLSSVKYMLECDNVLEHLPALADRHKHVFVTAVTNDATNQYNKKQKRSVLAESCFVHSANIFIVLVLVLVTS